MDRRGILRELRFVVLTLCACVFYAGCGLMYSPVVSTVLGTIEKDESGRGVGMNDLAMNVSPSIGIAIIGSLLGSNALAGSSVTGATGDAANYSNLLLIAAGTALLGLIVFFVFKKKSTKATMRWKPRNRLNNRT